ncbi:MAG TPA: tripartite tricarboxylate transporter substrate binding protein [Pseudolabrys sp.]|nr:tripartite tricarboxylate transporter substrate binding protein [Pseudolabrys sp.]
MLFASAGVGHAQTWPTKPIKLIVPFSAGGSADTLGRVFAQAASEKLGQPIVIENRPGAGGVVASAQVARAEPDGYTLVVSGVASHAIAPALNANTGYDPVRDFTHIAYFGGPPIVWVVHPSLNVQTLDALLKVVRSSQTFDFGSPGTGTQGHLVVAYMAHKLKLPLQHVPYKGAGPAMFDLIAGHVKMASVTWRTALGHIRAGTAVPIAVTSEKRMADYASVPTFKELGYPELVATTWFSVSGPAGMPKEIVDTLNRAFVAALEHPDVRSRLAQEGIDVKAMDAPTFTRFVEEEVVRWAPIVKASGAKAE